MGGPGHCQAGDWCLPQPEPEPEPAVAVVTPCADQSGLARYFCWVDAMSIAKLVVVVLASLSVCYIAHKRRGLWTLLRHRGRLPVVPEEAEQEAAGETDQAPVKRVVTLDGCA
jgi:hypothetical protein